MGTNDKDLASADRKTRCLIISGIDGSGKTTIINALKDRLETEGYSTAYIWLRFNHYFCKLLHAIARPLGLSVMANTEMGGVRQHRFYKSSLFCNVYIWAAYLDTWISRLKYNRVAKHRDFVICDRWITDIIVDLATKTHREQFIQSRWVKRFMSILPPYSHLFVVYRHTKDIIGCRLENRVDPDFRLRKDIYDQLVKSPSISPIDNCGTIEQSIRQIKKILEDEK